MSVVDNLSTDQRQLLEKIAQYTEGNRRTDKLAVCMQQFGKKWDCSHTAFVGLSLRALGFATTYKDAGQYARWDVTPLGKAALCELRNMTKPEPVVKKIQYAVFDTNMDGFQRFDTLDQAHKAASDWAKEEPDSEQIVMQVLYSVKAKLTVEKV